MCLPQFNRSLSAIAEPHTVQQAGQPNPKYILGNTVHGGASSFAFSQGEQPSEQLKLSLLRRGLIWQKGASASPGDGTLWCEAGTCLQAESEGVASTRKREGSSKLPITTPNTRRKPQNKHRPTIHKTPFWV